MKDSDTDIGQLRKELLDNPKFRARYEYRTKLVNLGAALRRARQQKDMSQQQVAAKAGIDQGDISRLENGEGGDRGPTIETLAKYAHAIDLDLLLALVAASQVKTDRDDRARAADDDRIFQGLRPEAWATL
jgi:transcriptional regulator with XRE-family HTH domain